MTERAKVSVSWLVTVVMVPIIALSGIRMLTSIDDIAKDVQSIKLDNAVLKTKMQSVEVAIIKLENHKP